MTLYERQLLDQIEYHEALKRTTSKPNMQYGYVEGLKDALELYRRDK